MSAKENMPPVKQRGSKIPVPNMLSVRKGTKRAISPNACNSDPKRSPSTSKRSAAAQKGKPETRNGGNQQRKTFGELPCDQRKIVKVRRGLNNGSTKAKTMKGQPKENVRALRKDIAVPSSTSGLFRVEELPDQSGIEFETEDSALQSILDETGIQYVQPQNGNQSQMSKFSRHTLAAVPKTRKDYAGVGPSRVKIEDFRKVCDDFINRNTNKQPNPKRQRTGSEFKSEDKFTLKLTPSKTDFSIRFGAEKNVTFQGVTPGLAIRHSLPGRSSVRNPDPFVLPGRSSISQTRRRLAKVGEQEVLGLTPGRASLAPQTPQRVLKKSKNEENQENMIQTPGRLSLSTQKPGRVSLSVQNVGRPSLSMQDPDKTPINKTPIKEKAANMCATPLRVKLLQTDQSTPKSTYQRVLRSASTIQHSPLRVQVQSTRRSPFSTPQEPRRVPKKVSTPSTPIRVPVISLTLDTPSRKTTLKNKPAEGVDLRTIWKTKKTPSKSPIMKEVLVKKEKGSTEVSKSKNGGEILPGAVELSIKKKKTLTWADTLEGCQTTVSDISETKDEQCATLQIKSKAFHNAMQDSPSQEISTSSPDNNTHVTTLTNNLHSVDNMQLPVCLTGSSSTHSASSTGNIDNENQPDLTDSCSNADHSLVSHPSTSFAQLETDSLLVSQQELGQHESNVLANKTQDEFLQKQIELFNEKKRQLAKLEMQIQEQLYKASNVGQATLDRDLLTVGLGQDSAVEQTANKNEIRQSDSSDLSEQVDNQHFSRNLNVCNKDFSLKGDDTLTQGINVSRQVNLDLNSNVTSCDTTLHNVNVKENLEVPSIYPSDLFSGIQNETYDFCTPSKQKERFDDQENITPYILKPKIDFEEITEASDIKCKLDFEKDNSNIYVGEEAEKVSVPLWTPLAMKTVAKQQTVNNVEHVDIEVTRKEKLRGESKLETDVIAKSDIDTSVVNSVDRLHGLVPSTSISESSTESGSYSETCPPKTPPNKRSAFRSLCSSGLTPVVGSLSLRGNIEDKLETQIMHQSGSLHNSVLRAANERYSEALLDDEVALFMCRLSNGNVLKGRDLCHDPIARILLEGDDMHFIPIEMDSNDFNSTHIQGSAFTKYVKRGT